MPTIFSHAFFGGVVGSAFIPDRLRARFLALTAFCTLLPDFDVIGFAFGVKYGSVLGHRGITHSISFALVIGWFVATACFRGLETARWKLALYFALVTASHPMLDMLTNGGLGVALLAPFSNERFFFPWRPVQVSPIGAGFFSERGMEVVLSEVLWIWLPGIVIAAVLWIVFRRWIRSEFENGNKTSNRGSQSLSSEEEV